MKYMTIDTNGIPTAFYDSEIHSVIPENAIKISDNEWQNYLNNQGKLKWDNTTKKFVSFDPDSVEPIDKLRDKLKLRAKNIRKQKIREGIIIHGTNTSNIYKITIDNTTISNLNGIIGLFNNGIKNITSDKVSWKFDNGVWEELSYDELIEISKFVSNFIERCFDVERSHHTSIESTVTDYNSFKNYDINSNWPNNIYNSTKLP